MDASEDLPNIGDIIDVAVTVATEEVTDDFLSQEGAGDVPPTQGTKGSEQNQSDEEKFVPHSMAVKEEGEEENLHTVGASSFVPSSVDKSGSNQQKKRIRRAGKVPIAKAPKLAEESSPSGDTAQSEQAMVVDTPKQEEVIEDLTLEEESSPPAATKHDEKWNDRFDKLLEYKAKNGNTMVPQCYQDDSRLGRWVHYQRVEYWVYQETGHAKITKERIARLDAIGFEWDPQNATWQLLFAKLKEFKDKVGHCRVPKGYTKDPELANWVRNQRLEEANRRKGKKSRMTQERYDALDELGFKWSSSTPSRSKNKDKKFTVEDPSNASGNAGNVATNEVTDPPFEEQGTEQVEQEEDAIQV